MIKTFSVLFIFFSFLVPLNASLDSDDEKANLHIATILMNRYAQQIQLNQWSELGSDFDEKLTIISALMDRLESPEFSMLRSSKEYLSFLSASVKFSTTMQAVATNFMSDPEAQMHYQQVMATQPDAPEEARRLPLTCLILSSIVPPPHKEKGKK